jgi:hypothetical protein
MGKGSNTCRMTNKKLKKKQKFIARKLARVETATIKPPENTLGVDYGKQLRNINGA